MNQRIASFTIWATISASAILTAVSAFLLTGPGISPEIADLFSNAPHYPEWYLLALLVCPSLAALGWSIAWPHPWTLVTTKSKAGKTC